MLLFEQHSWRAVVRDGWSQVRQGQVLGRGVPRDEHRYFLVVLSRAVVVDLISVANLPCFNGCLPWLPDLPGRREMLGEGALARLLHALRAEGGTTG